MPGILCEHCTGTCCRYIALPIETPTERADFDDIRWYLLHENISVFVEAGEWYINIPTNCRHLQPDFRCGIYETRPRICRSYATSDCDYHSGDYGWEQHFTCPEHLDEFVRNYFRSGAGKKRRSKTAKRGRSRLRVRLPHRHDYAAATSDLRGVPLPVIPAAARQ
ncbi:MAG: YkgJ family cysteine cluster protein [Planctomycetes bacterium]|nr:YkgJ family cysteine cluster protein [Planctomycetota bacterium]